VLLTVRIPSFQVQCKHSIGKKSYDLHGIRHAPAFRLSQDQNSHKVEQTVGFASLYDALELIKIDFG